MRCTSCGLPLSPTHTPAECPRCGTPTGAASAASQPQYQQAFWEPVRVVDAVGTSPSQYQWPPDGQSAPELSTPSQWSGQPYKPDYSQVPPPQIPGAQSTNNTKLGFIIAAMFILAGSMILIFVYFTVSGLPGGGSSNSTSSNNSGNTSNAAMSTPTTAPTATAIPTQTATTFPGQQYIDNAQTSAGVDQNTLQPSQPTNTFKTGQNIYISFQVHPNGQAGAVCIIWYLNSKPVTNFSLPVSATSKHSYAYAIYGGAGPAYVELYWASSTQCTDKVLAQHVDFTVTS